MGLFDSGERMRQHDLAMDRKVQPLKRDIEFLTQRVLRLEQRAEEDRKRARIMARKNNDAWHRCGHMPESIGGCLYDWFGQWHLVNTVGQTVASGITRCPYCDKKLPEGGEA